MFFSHQYKKNYFKFILFSVFLILVFSGCGKSDEYTLVNAKKENLVEIVDADGMIEANTQTDLTFQRSGKISEILVSENQEVKKGDLLATLDSERLQIAVDRASASLNMVKAQLNLKYSAPTSQTVDLSNIQIEEAKIALSHTSQKLEDMKKSNAQKIVIAEQELKNLKTKQKNAELSYKNTQDKGDIDTTVSQKSFDDNLEKSKKQFISALDVIRNSISLSTRIIDPEDSAGREQQIFIGFHSSQKLQAKDKYQRLLSHFSQTELSLNTALLDWNKSSINETSKELKKTAIETKELLDMLYELMETSVTNKHLTVAEVESFKNEITAQQNFLTSQLASIRDLEQIIENANLGIKKSDISSISQLDTAASTLDDIKNSILLAEENLENIKIQATSAEQDILRELELKKLALKKAQANHSQLLAKPRYVDVAQLKANISQQEASIRQAKKDLEDTKIIAPFDGVVTKINFDIGENILPSQVAIVLMSKELQVIANIPEIDISKVKKGDKVSIELDSFGPEKLLKGHIEKIDDFETDIQGAVYYQATIVLDNTEEGENSYYSQIKPGMSGDVSITQDSTHTALLLPQSALEYKEGKYFVSVFKDGEFIKTPVKIGMRIEDRVEITSGISENDSIAIFIK